MGCADTACGASVEADGAPGAPPPADRGVGFCAPQADDGPARTTAAAATAGRCRRAVVRAKSHARAVRVRERAVYHTVAKCSIEVQRFLSIRAPGLAPSARPLIPSRSCPLPQAPALRAPPPAAPPGCCPPLPRGLVQAGLPPRLAPSTHWRRLWLSRSASPPQPPGGSRRG